MHQNIYLTDLAQLVEAEQPDVIYACIEDLVINGLQLSRFTPSDRVPGRQDVTQYLATWCRAANLTEDVCRKWLSDYAEGTLRSISRSSASAIRHSTKGNVRYVYRSSVPFVCGCEDNVFRANCNSMCPVYAEMKAKAAAPVEKVLRSPRPLSPTVPQQPVFAISVKEQYREQFKAATQLIRREMASGTKKSGILALLKAQGLKTRTGREWTSSILDIEIRKLGTPPR